MPDQCCVRCGVQLFVESPDFCGGARTHNKQQEDARHFYISFSIHCLRPVTQRYATFKTDADNDFFPHRVVTTFL